MRSSVSFARLRPSLPRSRCAALRKTPKHHTAAPLLPLTIASLASTSIHLYLSRALLVLLSLVCWARHVTSWIKYLLLLATMYIGFALLTTLPKPDYIHSESVVTLSAATTQHGPTHRAACRMRSVQGWHAWRRACRTTSLIATMPVPDVSTAV